MGYLEAVQRALRMPQCRLIPFFGTFLRDLYAIVNEMPNIVVIGNEGEVEKLKFLNDSNGDVSCAAVFLEREICLSNFLKLTRKTISGSLFFFHRSGRTIKH